MHSYQLMLTQNSVWFYNIFPVRFVWLGGLWQIIGAGSPGLFALVHAQIADVCTTKQRYFHYTIHRVPEV